MQLAPVKLAWQTPTLRATGRMRLQQALKWALIAFGSLLLALSAKEMYRFASDPAVSLWHFFKFDTLFPAALYEDMAADFQSLRQWRFTGATDIYPDVLLYMAARWITGGVAPAMVVCTCVLFALLILSIAFLYGSLTDRSQRHAQLAALLGLAAIFLLLNVACNFRKFALLFPLVLTYHAGSAICVISGLAIVIGLLFAKVWNWRHRLGLVALVLQTALCMASDRLILVQLIVPCIATMAFARGMLGSTLPGKRLGWTGGALILSALLGHLLLRLIQPAFDDFIRHGRYSFESLGKGLGLAVTGTARQLADGDVLHIVAVATLAAAIAYVAAVSWCRLRGTASAETVNRRQFFMAAFFVAMTGSTLGAAALSGQLVSGLLLDTDYLWAVASRYLIPLLLLPFFLLPLTVGAIARSWQPRSTGWGFAVLTLAVTTALLVTIQRQPRGDGQDVWNYYPPVAREMDEQAARFGLKHGLAESEKARIVTLFSRQGLRVRSIIRCADSPSGASPFPHLDNVNWHADRAGSRYGGLELSFIILHDEGLDHDFFRTASRAEVLARFGEPAETVTVNGSAMLIYNRPTDEAFRLQHLIDYRFIRETFSFNLRDVVRFPGCSLPSKIVPPVPLQPRIAIEGRESPGLLTDGPEMIMRKKGVYRVRALISSQSRTPSGRFEIFLLDPMTTQKELCGVLDLPVGDQKEVSLLLTIGDRLLGRALVARVSYHGIGNLEVHSIEVERSP